MATPTNLPAAVSVGDLATASFINDLRGSFRVLQVKEASTATQVDAPSATFVDVGLSITITPQSASSKILIINAQSVFALGGAIDANIRFVRTSTAIYTSRNAIFPTSGLGASVFSIHMDSPNTTSATNYKVQGNTVAGAGTARFQVSAVAASSLFLFEISA